MTLPIFWKSKEIVNVLEIFRANFPFLYLKKFGFELTFGKLANLLPT